MTHTFFIRAGLAGVVLAMLGLRSASVQSDPTFTAGTPPTIAQIPLYMRDAVPPLNMLVMGKDHKIYYEAYNDASDLNGDGILDVGYKPNLTYYGYFNSFACYNWDTGNGGRFVPVSATSDKRCSGRWSGDFLNYLTTSRMDALRRVLYGGWRNVDTTNETILQGAFFPQDAHSWGKEYQSVARDGYDISQYAPLPLPEPGRYHLFAVTTVTGNANTFPNYQAPLFRVLSNSPFRVWNWLSIEGPVAGNNCFNASNQRVNCLGAAQAFPGHPGDRTAFDTLQSNYAVSANLYGTSSLDRVDCSNNACNLQGADDEYLSIITGAIRINNGRRGDYQFRIDGDDVIDFTLYENGVQVASAGCYNTAGRGFGACGGNEQTAVVDMRPNRTYTFMFRHEEGSGGDGYRLEWRRTDGGNAFTYRVLRQNGDDTGANGNGGINGNLTASFYDLTPSTNGSARNDYLVRMQVCPADAGLRDSTCKTYPAGTHKPTGILHDYGENQRMYFGLITGSQRNNLEGGMLRRNVTDFAGEINADNGIFRTDVEGIVRSIDRLRMIGGGYNSGTTDNLNSDSNWNWANGNGNCPSIGERAINNGECRMWGNPIAEMLYEGLRYFAGAGESTPRFSTTGGSTAGSEDATLGLPSPAWRDPYGNTGTGLNYPACAKPYQTIISDINPSYDGDLPGSAFAGAVTSTGITPSSISSFNAAAEGQAIWIEEFGAGTRNVFIGEAGGTSDGAPTPKAASSFGNIRGLAPEEPTKGGSYYSASVARFGRNSDVNAAADAQNISTYSIALASPLPRIEFPVNGRTVTLLPFAKTVSGTFGGGARKPTNTIVDFYVEGFANFPGQPINTTVNGGRAQAIFRINYEDVEQGNDHDMDAIVRYLVQANADDTVTVTLDSEYAAGSANQNIGYVISGTTRDGIYLEVRDRDSGQGTSVNEFNTPPGVWAGGCVGATGTAPCNQGLGLASTRTFTLGAGGNGFQLQNPLWYAAKYGAPDPLNWDTNSDGVPDNYFLVTNPLNLRTQLSRAFDDIANRNLDVGNRAISGARVQSGSFTLQPGFSRNRNGKDWVGDLAAVSIYPDGSLGPTIWRAQTNLPPDSGNAALRNIRTITNAGAGTAATKTAAEFQDAALGANNNDRLIKLGINPVQVTTLYGASYTSADFVAYLRGDQSREASAGTLGSTLRTRSSVLGDIVNSEPVVSSPRSDFGYGNYTDSMFSGYANTGSSGYLYTKRNRQTVAFVGANDGMLHAFDASTRNCPADAQGRVIACPTGTSGEELFGFIPNAVLGNLGRLALPDNNYEHRYYVDGQLSLGDAKDGSTWKTLLIASAGGGARSVFALDVSNIENSSSFSDSQILWERNSFVDRDIGNVYGKPLLVPLESNQWGVLFGNGYGGNRSDPSLYILNAFTGAVIKKITANDGNLASTSFIGGLICTAADFLIPGFDGCAQSAAPYNGLGQITAIDRDGNGKVDTVYGGDLQGNLWKFDLRGSAASSWDVYNYPSVGRVPLFTAATGTERQPITGGIRVAAGPGTGVMVFFGTGRYFVNGDNDVPANPQIQSLYAAFDNAPLTGTTGSSPAGGRANLVAQTITTETTAGGFITRNISRNAVSYFGSSAARGWYLDLKLENATTGSGERFIATPRIQSGRVFFTTYTPTEDSCSPGGTNFQYGLDLLSGVGTLANISVLPSGTAACTNAECGGVAVRDANGNVTQPPITGTGVVATNPITNIAPCVGPDCPTFEQCQVVIYPGAFVLPRPCGRQSWRQLK